MILSIAPNSMSTIPCSFKVQRKVLTTVRQTIYSLQGSKGKSKLTGYRRHVPLGARNRKASPTTSRARRLPTTRIPHSNLEVSCYGQLCDNLITTNNGKHLASSEQSLGRQTTRVL